MDSHVTAKYSTIGMSGPLFNCQADQNAMSFMKKKAFIPTPYTSPIRVFSRKASRMHLERTPLPAGTIIPVSDTDIRIKRDGTTDDYSAGSSCLVYRGHIESGTGIVTGTHVIIKEFYPAAAGSQFDIKRDQDGSLHLASGTEEDSMYSLFMEQFLQGLNYQKELAGSNAMEISVRPLFFSKWGDSLYIISDAHNGVPAEKTQRTLQETLSFTISFTEAMGILHENGYIMTDIKADNFLWIQKPNTVRIIDTDSLIPYKNTERLARQPLFTNENHWSPELRFLHRKIREGTPENELVEQKKSMLNPNADRYAMGVFFFELFFNRLPDFSGRDVCFGSRSRFPINRRASAAMNRYMYRNPDNAESYSSGTCLNQGENEFQSHIEELTDLYGDEITAAGCTTSLLLQSILHILRKLLIYNPFERKKAGYKDDSSIVSDLQTIYTQLTSETLVLRRETASANARFSAYNLLQKHPLFEYRSADRQRLSVAIIGRHAMRQDMLSAVLSIGQMPDLPLHIALVAEDADDFWHKYISDAHNPALARAVTWDYGDKQTVITPCHPGDLAAEYDPDLVERPLAHLTIQTLDFLRRTHEYDSSNNSIFKFNNDKHGEKECDDEILLPGCFADINYYILLEEDPKKRELWARQISAQALKKKQKILIGFLSNEEEEISKVSTSLAGDNQLITCSPISTKAFTESYSEKMFSEKIYDMGFMAHAYYSGAMQQTTEGTPSIDMKALKQQYRSNLYSIFSSERCALHGAYKLAGLGIDRNVPGRFLRYYRKSEDPEILEELAWIEHLSWTAFMLTSGAVPLPMGEFDSTAYQDQNDWKDQRDTRHLRHPLLAASSRSARHTLQNISRLEDVTPEMFELLDPLDKVSIQIARWYASHREFYRDQYQKWISGISDLCDKKFKLVSQKSLDLDTDTILSALKSNGLACLSALSSSGLACIDRMGIELGKQDTRYRQSWEEAVKDLQTLFEDPHFADSGLEDLLNLIEQGKRSIMKPVFDSLECRDFKQSDRNLAYAVIDIIA